MKSTVNLLLSIGLLLSLCNCGGPRVSQRPPSAAAYRSTSPNNKPLAHIDMPVVGDPQTADIVAFNDDTNSFENIEEFALGNNNDTTALAFSENLDDDSTALAFNDFNNNNVGFSWEALEEETQEVFETVYFNWDDAGISQEEHPKITTNVEHAKELIEEGKTIICKGKACKFGGTEVHNLALSDQRAQAVAHELEAAGIPKDYIKAFGVGTQESLAMGDTKEDHARDRCVEMYTITI